MREDVSDGQLSDVRYVDPADLIAEPSIRTGLDRIVAINAAGLYGFTNAI
jgi:hypothetical protein